MRVGGQFIFLAKCAIYLALYLQKSYSNFINIMLKCNYSTFAYKLRLSSGITISCLRIGGRGLQEDEKGLFTV